MIKGHIAPTTGIMTCATSCAKLTVMSILGGMTGITVRGCGLIDTIAMTCLTLNIRVFPGQWEGSIVMIERDIRPFGGFMTGTTACSKLSVVSILGSVTRVTILGRALEDTIAMTGLTGNIGMRSHQREGSLAMIEGYILPTGCVVAGRTHGSKLTIMGVLGSVTGIAISGCAFEYTLGVAGHTLHILVLPS